MVMVVVRVVVEVMLKESYNCIFEVFTSSTLFTPGSNGLANPRDFEAPAAAFEGKNYGAVTICVCACVEVTVCVILNPTVICSHALSQLTSPRTHSLTHSPTHSTTHPTTYSLTHSLSPLLQHSLQIKTASSTPSSTRCARPITHSLSHSLAHPLTHSLSRPPTHPLTYHSLPSVARRATNLQQRNANIMHA